MSQHEIGGIMEDNIKVLGSIILIYISIFNFKSFEFKIKDLILMIALAECISVFLFKNSEFLINIPILIIPTIFIYLKRKNVFNSISISFISLIIAVISDYIVGNVLVLVLGVDANLVRESNKVYFMVIATEWIFAFVISKLIGFLVNKVIKVENLARNKKFALLIVGSLILTVTIFYINIIFQSQYGLRNEIVIINGILFLSYFILLMIIMYILIQSISKELEVKKNQSLIENLQQYTSSLELMNTEIRGFRHDYVNILASMLGFIEDDDMKGLKNHFYNNVLPVSEIMESNNYKIVLLKNIRIPEIKGIFSAKLLRAQELGIDVFIDIAEEVEQINMDIIDLSRIVGILLDNAIEAAEKCDKPHIEVGLINKESSIMMIIINSCSKEVPPVYKIYEKGFSTKGDNRGVGLSNLKEITQKYSGVTLETIIENNEFKQYLEFNKG
jgi:two-component system sensor histidine kinase AgrC